METTQSYRAKDGSLHATREGAAIVELAAILRVSMTVAHDIIDKREAVSEVLNQVSGHAYIKAYLPEPEAPAAEAA